MTRPAICDLTEAVSRSGAEKKAFELGSAAFRNNVERHYSKDPACVKLYGGEEGTPLWREVSKAWYDGWDRANLDDSRQFEAVVAEAAKAGMGTGVLADLRAAWKDQLYATWQEFLHQGKALAAVKTIDRQAKAAFGKDVTCLIGWHALRTQYQTEGWGVGFTMHFEFPDPAFRVKPEELTAFLKQFGIKYIDRDVGDGEAHDGWQSGRTSYTFYINL